MLFAFCALATSYHNDHDERLSDDSIHAWVCDCDHRVPITITGSTVTLTDFQLKIKIPSTPGIDADYGNVLFTTSDGETPIDHWIQTGNATEGIAWVQVPSIPTSSTTIYMYYEDCGSSGIPGDVFEYFNDFTSSSGIIDYRNGDFSTETYSGASVLRKENNCDPNGAEMTLNFTIDDYILITQETRPNDGSSNSGCGLNRYGILNSDYDGYSINRNGHSGNNFGVERRNNGGGGNNSGGSITPSIPRDTFVITELKRCTASNLNEAELFSNAGVSLATRSSSIGGHNYSDFDRIMIHGGHDFLIDYVALAQNACTYPTYAIGSEESFDCDKKIWVNPFIKIKVDH